MFNDANSSGDVSDGKLLNGLTEYWLMTVMDHVIISTTLPSLGSQVWHIHNIMYQVAIYGVNLATV